MFNKKVLVCLLFSLMLISCKEETIEPELLGTITGKVYDSITQEAIQGASVTTNPASSAVITAADGTFRIDNIKVGDYALRISKNGYTDNTVSVSVRAGQSTSAFVYLEKKSSLNEAPSQPVSPYPADGSTEQTITIKLSWSASDKENDNLKYDVNLYKSNTLNILKQVKDITDTTLLLENLEYNTTYFWQVSVKDSFSVTNGVVWSFKTKAFPFNVIVYAGEQDGNYDIYSSDSSAVSTNKLTSSLSRDWYPRFSPRLEKIAFISDRNTTPQIFIMNYDGTNVQQVTTLAVTGYNNSGIGFCWSDNGDYLYYSHYDKLYRINSDGSNRQTIAAAPAGRNFREVATSSDGSKLAVLAVGMNPYDSEIYVLNPDGSGMVQFIDNVPGSLGSPEFTLDSKSLMFTKDNSGYEVPEGRQLDSDIMIISLDKSDTLNVSINKTEGTNDLYPRFSPDGSKIVFTNVRNDGIGDRKVYSMDVYGNNRKMLFNKAAMPDWK